MKPVSGVILIIMLGIAVFLVACSPVLDLSFAKKIIVERYYNGNLLTAVQIVDASDIQAIVRACTETAKRSSSNMSDHMIKLIFMNDRKQVALWPAGDRSPYFKLDDGAVKYFGIDPEASVQLFSTIEKYGIIIGY